MTGNADNASLEGVNIINIDNRSIVTPFMTKEDYLPAVFTVEFDAYFNDTYSHWQKYFVRFYPVNDTHRQVIPELIVYPFHLYKNGASIQSRVKSENEQFEKQEPHQSDGSASWKHTAISYNQRPLKVFINEERILLHSKY